MKKILNSKNSNHCKICKSIKTEDSYIINKYIFAKCNSCGFEFVRNPPKRSDLLKFYNHKDYIDPQLSEKRIREDAKISLDLIENIILEKRTLIDIGCGRGYFLDEARSRGWEVFGVDYSQDVINYAKKTLNLNVRKNDWLSEQTLIKYDLLTMSQFIEHFEDPNLVVKKAYDYIKSKGYIYIATPNIASLSAEVLREKFDHYIPPEHLSLFGEKSLTKLLNNNGFTVKFSGTWSYQEELAGIMKRLLKNDNTNKNDNSLSKNTNPTYYKEEPKNTKKRIKYYFFDQLFCGSCHSILDIFGKGSMIEIIGQKNE